jgi:hypothetical protein
MGVNLGFWRILGPKRGQESGENCITRSFVICTLRQVEKDEMGGAYSTNGERRNAMLLVEKPGGKKPLGRPRRR